MRITQVLGNPDADRLDELKNVRNVRREFRDEADFRGYMESHGFHCMGEGYYGMVFTHPSFYGRYVLKVFQDAYYEWFIKIAQANASNPHFPRYVGKLMRVTDSVRMVRIEHLEEISAADFEDLGGTFGFMDLKSQADAVAHGEIAIEDCEFDPKLRGFFEAMVEVIRRKPPTARMDLSRHNVMKRAQTLVITDPYMGADHFSFGDPIA